MLLKNLAIKQKLLLLSLLITFTCILVYTLYHYYSEKTAILQAIDNTLRTAAYAVPQILPENYHNRIQNAASISPEEQKKNLMLMSDYTNTVGLKYIYSFMRINGKIVFTSCSATSEELKKGTYTKFFEEYHGSSAGMQQAFKTDAIQFVNERDEYGYWRSVLIPLKTVDGRTYVVGADIPITFVHQRVRMLLITCIVIGFIFLGVFFTLSYFLAEKMAAPIVELTRCTRDIVSHQFDFSTLSTKNLETIAQTFKDEIGELASTFHLMQHELQKYIINLKETTAAKERIESELKIAHDIQMNLLPHAFPGAPKHPELEIHALLQPAKEVGGDLYDTFELDENRIFFAIGDVSDKGVPAALFMAVTKALFRAYAQEHLSLGEVVQVVNNELCRDNESQMFVTIFCGIINLQTGEIEYCDGGHENPFIAVARDQAVVLLEKKGGMALGFMPDIPYQSDTFILQPGDTFFLYTDGVNEAMNPERKQFTVPRLQACLAETINSCTEKITQHVLEQVHAHAAGAPQSDDITVMAIRYLGKPTNI